jgi:hypothetical protein
MEPVKPAGATWYHTTPNMLSQLSKNANGDISLQVLSTSETRLLSEQIPTRSIHQKYLSSWFVTSVLLNRR